MSDRLWYYAIDEKPKGPVSEPALHAMLAKGELTWDTLVWCETLTDWTPASRIETFRPITTPPSGPHPSEPSTVASSDLAPRSPQADRTPRTYVVRHWRGDLSLATSYWGNLILVTVLYTIAINVLIPTDIADALCRDLAWGNWVVAVCTGHHPVATRRPVACRCQPQESHPPALLGNARAGVRGLRHFQHRQHLCHPRLAPVRGVRANCRWPRQLW